MIGLATLEEPLALVARHDRVEEALLGARVVEVVVDYVVSERRARHGAVLECLDRLQEGVREALGVRLVRVPLERRRQLERILDAVEAGCQDGREGKVGIDVAARDSRLRPQALAVADDAEAAGAVVVPPREGRRRPASRGVALVGVDRRREEDRELLEARDLAGQELLEHLRLAGERALLAAPEA